MMDKRFLVLVGDPNADHYWIHKFRGRYCVTGTKERATRFTESRAHIAASTIQKTENMMARIAKSGPPAKQVSVVELL